jgi:hypothetical protein
VLATSVYLIVFRIVHVVAAIVWGGALFLFVVYVQPSVAAIAPAGAPFLREMLGRRRVTDFMLSVAGTTIVGGAFLYWHDMQQAGGFADWIQTSFGGWLTVGSVAAIVAFLVGLFVTRPNAQRMLALGARVAEAGGQPTPDLASEMAATQSRLKLAARTSLALVAIAAFTMATARYW